MSAIQAVCLASGAQAQEALPTSAMSSRLDFARLTIEDGLAQNTVLTLLQDRQGFMWLGTTEGLHRYDGATFTLYRHDPADSTSLSDNYIEVVYEDRAGTMWVGTSNGGLHRFDRELDRFTRVGAEHLHPYNVTWLYEDSSDRFWIGTQGGGLFEMDRGTGGFTHYGHDPDDATSLSNDRLWQIIEDVRDPELLWVATEDGLSRLHVGSGEFVRFHHEPGDPLSLSDDDVRSLHTDARGTLWAGTWGGGLNRYQRETEAFVPVTAIHEAGAPVGRGNIWDIEEEPSAPGALWLATYGGGLLRFETSTGRVTTYRHDADNPRSVGSDRVKAIHVDRAGAVWLGTWNGGVSRIDRVAKPFHRLTVLDGLNPNPVLAVAGDPTSPSRVWLGTSGGGLSRVDLATGDVAHFRNEPGNPRSLSFDRVRTVTADHEGSVWAGTESGIVRFDSASRDFTRFTTYPGSPGGFVAVTELIEDPSSPGTFWVGLYDGGLHRVTGLGAGDPEYRSFLHDPEDPRSLSNDRVQALAFDRRGTLWVGTVRGLNRFDRNSGEFTRFPHDPDDPRSLSHNSVAAIHDASEPGDPGPDLWIGTDNGLNRLIAERGEGGTAVFARYGEGDGLPSTQINGILEDGRSRLWISTNKGISRFDPATGDLTNFDVSDGLQSNEFGLGAVFQSPNGWMFMGGLNGINVFHPDSIRSNPHIPPVVFTAIQVNGSTPAIGGEGSPLLQHIAEVRSLTLSHEQNVLSLDFAALDFTAPHRNRYAYRMEGFDPEWRDGGNRGSATYTNLDPGTYVFRVRGSNNDGVWDDAGAAIEIIILPPWWQTWWAYALYGAAALSLLYAVRRYEMNRIHLRNQLELEHVEAQKLRELDAIKSRFFANISHEFRTPLTLLLGPVEGMLARARDAQDRKNLGMMRRQARHLLQLINQLLDLSKLEAGRLELQTAEQDLVPILREAVSVFRSMAERKGLQLGFHSEVESVSLSFDQDKIETVVNNLLSNAIKFTPRGGKVSLALHVEEDGGRNGGHPACVVVSVKDTGVGIPAEQLPKIFERFYQADDDSNRNFEGTGIGLSLAKELVELHQGMIEVRSQEGWGTEAVVRLPLRRGRRDGEVSPPVSDAVAPRIGPSSRLLDDPAAVDSVAGGTELASLFERAGEPHIILVVDDHADMRSYIRQHLVPNSEVVEAETGQEGLEVALEMIPDLVISDVMMPKMDGYEFCRALKDDERTSHVPVILLTAKATPGERLEGLETGADAYLVKPFDPDELKARVNNLIELRRTLREKYSSAAIPELTPALESKIDQAFLKRVQNAIEENLTDEDFGVEELAKKLWLSRTQLHRKITALTDRPASSFIRSVRLHHARRILGEGGPTIGEAAFRVGFSSHAYFSKCFREEFGMTPRDFIKSRQV